MTEDPTDTAEPQEGLPKETATSETMVSEANNELPELCLPCPCLPKNLGNIENGLKAQTHRLDQGEDIAQTLRT